MLMLRIWVLRAFLFFTFRSKRCEHTHISHSGNLPFKRRPMFQLSSYSPEKHSQHFSALACCYGNSSLSCQLWSLNNQLTPWPFKKEKRWSNVISVLGNSLLKGTWGWLHSRLRNNTFSSVVHGYRSLATCAGSRLSSLTTSTTQNYQSLSFRNGHHQMWADDCAENKAKLQPLKCAP